MKLQALGLKNFRQHENIVLQFSDYTILRGPNMAGKTSIMLGISWALTGANSFTTRDGKNWEHLIRNGSDPRKITATLSIEDFGHIERSRAAKGHQLLLPDATSVSATKNQSVLYERLGVHPEVLSVVLDPKPFIDRDASAQRDALTKALRPEKIEVTEAMKQHGITNIIGAEHLQAIIKEQKNDVLRALNAEARTLEKQRSDRQRPTWPFKGRTEEAIKRAYEEAVSKKEAAAALCTELRLKLLQVAEKLEADFQVFEILPDQERIQLAKLLDQARKEVTAADQLKNDLGKNITELYEKMKAATALTNELAGYGHGIEVELAGLVDPVECSAPECPVLQSHHMKTLGQKQNLSTRKDELEKQFIAASQESTRLNELNTTEKANQQKAAATLKKWGASAVDLQQQLTNDETQRELKQVYDTERQSTEELRIEDTKLASELQEQENQLRILKGVVTKGDEALAKILEHHRLNALASEWGQAAVKNMDQITATSSLIKALELLKKNIVGEHMDEFFQIMTDFLQPFAAGKLGYSWEEGFNVNGVPIAYESDGCALMMFEAAFRVAIAKTTGIGLVVLDQKAPLSRTNEQHLARQLLKSGCQVIQSYTTDVRGQAPPPGAKFTVWFIDRDGDDTKIEQI